MPVRAYVFCPRKNNALRRHYEQRQRRTFNIPRGIINDQVKRQKQRQQPSKPRTQVSGVGLGLCNNATLRDIQQLSHYYDRIQGPKSMPVLPHSLAFGAYYIVSYAFWKSRYFVISSTRSFEIFRSFASMMVNLPPQLSSVSPFDGI